VEELRDIIGFLVVVDLDDIMEPEHQLVIRLGSARLNKEKVHEGLRQLHLVDGLPVLRLFDQNPEGPPVVSKLLEHRGGLRPHIVRVNAFEARVWVEDVRFVTGVLPQLIRLVQNLNALREEFFQKHSLPLELFFFHLGVWTFDEETYF
jgi:hypothetical protein